MVAQHGENAIRCLSCGGQVHAVASNWDNYSYGHGGGHVDFLTVCSKCGKVDTGYISGTTWSKENFAGVDKLVSALMTPRIDGTNGSPNHAENNPGYGKL